MPGDDAHPFEPGEGPSPPVQALVDALLDGEPDTVVQQTDADAGAGGIQHELEAGEA